MSTMIDETSNNDIDPLTRLSIKYGSDKWGMHFYTPVYHSLFCHMRNKPVRLIEIGIGGYAFAKVGGASLSMWADYFPKGHILGVDIAEKRLPLDPRIQVRQGSQDDPVFLTRMSEEFGPFDIVIDDGSHKPKHVAASFSILFPKLADHGLYVIEDVQTCFWPRFGASVLDGGATMGLAKAVLEHLHHAEIKIVQPERQVADYVKSIRSFRAYHNLFIIEKGDNDEPSNFNYHLDNVHAARALRIIQHELEQSPTAAGYATLIGVYRAAQKLSEAWAIANEALAKWPHDSTLLCAALRLAAASGDAVRRLEFLRRLAALDKDDAALQALVRKVEAEIVPRAPSS